MIHDRLPPLDGNLDLLIRPVVLAMRDAGFRTVASCEGHEDVARQRWPTVVLEPQPRPEAIETADRLVEWCQVTGLAGCTVSIDRWVYGPNNPREGFADEDEVFVRVEWWTKRPIWDWLGEEVPSSN